MYFQYKHVLRCPMYLSVYRTVTVSVQSVWPIVFQGKILLHFSVHCPTATQLIPHLSAKNPQNLFCDFTIFPPVNVAVNVWYYSLQEDAWFPTVLTHLIPLHTRLKPQNVIR